MDEATSSLDTASEQLVQKVIEEFKTAGKTVIVIAHRLSTITKADTILVMDKGRMVEQGNHKDLLEKKGFYFNLWEKASPNPSNTSTELSASGGE